MTMERYKKLKQLCNHSFQCEDSKCNIKNCKFIYLLLKHYRTCNNINCTICKRLREYIKNDYETNVSIKYNKKPYIIECSLNQLTYYNCLNKISYSPKFVRPYCFDDNAFGVVWPKSIIKIPIDDVDEMLASIDDPSAELSSSF